MVESLKSLYINFGILNFFIIGVSPLTVILSVFFLDVLSPQQWAYVLTIHLVIIAITDYPTGGLSDTIGRDKTFSIAGALFSLTYLLIALNQSFAVIAIAMVISGLANAQYSGTLDVWFANEYHRLGGKNFRDIMGKVFGFNILILIPGYALFPYIADVEGFPLLFAIISIMMGIMAILGLFLMKEPKYVNEGEEGTSEDQNQRPSYLTVLKSGYKPVFENKVLFYLSMFGILAGIITQVTQQIYFTPEFIRVGLPLSQVGYPRIITAMLGIYISLNYSKLFGSRGAYNQYKQYQKWKQENPDVTEVPDQFQGLGDTPPKFVYSQKIIHQTSILLSIVFLVFFGISRLDSNYTTGLIFAGMFIVYAVIRRISLVSFASYQNAIIAQTPQLSSSIKSFVNTLETLVISISFLISAYIMEIYTFSHLAIFLSIIAFLSFLINLKVEKDN